MIRANNKKKTIVFIIKSLLQIFLITTFGFGFMILISPESKALKVFLLSYSIIFIVIVIFAVYINYVNNLYKEIKKNKP